MNPNACFAFYGSLRRGMYNHEKHQDYLKFLFCATLPGFTLHALERYPIAVKTGNPAQTIEVEVFEITHTATHKAIYDLEMGAGYYLDWVEIKGIRTGIYLFDKPQEYPLVPEGDWVKFFREKSGQPH